MADAFEGAGKLFETTAGNEFGGTDAACSQRN